MRAVLAVLALGIFLSGCATPSGEPLQQGLVEPSAPRAERSWAPVETAQIRPGTPIETTEGACASNFMFTKSDNTSVFLGTTAYCVRQLPIGALVTVGDPKNIGILVYSSWVTMAENGEKDPHAREYNDFAVIRLDDSARNEANPSLLHAEGPRGAENVALGARVRAFSPPAAPGLSPWHDAVVTGAAGSWAHLAHSPHPPLPGQMGGAVVTEDADAVGITVSLGLVPNPGAIGIARIDALMAYAADHAKLDMVLATAG